MTLLDRGDTVAVVATGFAVKPSLLRAGVRRLERMGYRVQLGEHVLARDGYLAGDDAARADDLRRALRDPAVRAVWFARGGYGTARILDRVPWSTIRRRHVTLIGYSDLTSLFCGALRRTETVCLYGPVVTELGDPATYHAPSLRRCLAGKPSELRFRGGQVLVPGRGRGRLVGGNLTVLAHQCGTRFFPDLRGAVLFLEDVGEMTYRIDRALNQLEQAAALRDLAGVLLGRFSAPRRRRFPPDRSLEAVLAETFAPLGVPVVSGLPAGHIARKRTLPLGGIASIDTRAGRVRLAP